MKSSIIIALLSAFLAAGVPLNKRQGGGFSTTTEIVIDTIWTTTTIWVPSSSAAAYNNNNNNGVVPSSSQAPSSSAAPPPPSPTTFSTYVPPVTTTNPPTTTYAPPPVTTTAAPYVAPAPANPPPAATTSPSNSGSGSSGGSSSTTGQYGGDITYYDIEVGTTSCGTTGTNGQMLVALAAGMMQNGANPNANPLCNKVINIYYQGNVQQGTIVDTCPTCNGGSLDLTPALFKAVAPNGDGRVSGVTWSFAS